MSIYELSRDIEGLLRAKNFPLRVTYGPERMHREGYPDHAIVFERDRTGASDPIALGTSGAQTNPRKLGVRNLLGVIHLYARSSSAGAHVGTHEALCEKYVDAVLAALRNWATSMRAVNIPVTEARYLSADERLQLARAHMPASTDPKVFAAIEAWPGVVYQIKFQLPRALLDLDYAGQGLPESDLGGLSNVTTATGPGFSSGQGCGS